MNDLLEYVSTKIYKKLENSFDRRITLLEYLIGESPLIFLYKRKLLDCKDISSSYLPNHHYYSIITFKIFNLIEYKDTKICDLSKLAEIMLRKYILEKDLSKIARAKYEYIRDSNFFEELGEDTLLALCKNLYKEENFYHFPKQYFIYYFIIEKLYGGVEKDTPYIIELLRGNRRIISLLSLYLLNLNYPNWFFKQEYIIENIENIAGHRCVNLLFTSRGRERYTISHLFARMKRFVIRSSSNAAYKKYKISQEGKEFIEYILMQIYPIEYSYKNHVKTSNIII
jgi:hypothetical protein